MVTLALVFCIILTVTSIWIIIVLRNRTKTIKILKEHISENSNKLTAQKKDIDHLTQLYQQFCSLNYMILNSDLKNDFISLKNNSEMDDKVNHLISRMKTNMDETEKIRKKIIDG